MTNRVPVNSVDLISRLDEMFPHKCATKGMDIWDIAYEAGRRALIDSLVTWQELDILDNTEQTSSTEEY